MSAEAPGSNGEDTPLCEPARLGPGPRGWFTRPVGRTFAGARLESKEGQRRGRSSMVHRIGAVCDALTAQPAQVRAYSSVAVLRPSGGTSGRIALPESRNSPSPRAEHVGQAPPLARQEPGPRPKDVWGWRTTLRALRLASAGLRRAASGWLQAGDGRLRPVTSPARTGPRYQHATADGWGHAWLMSCRVIVHPPAGSGGRRVRCDGKILGLAYAPRDLLTLVRRAGLPLRIGDLYSGEVVEWRGVGPTMW